MKRKSLPKSGGNSLGVILPREMVKAESIKEHQKLVIKVETRQLGCKLMGILKHWRKSHQKIKMEQYGLRVRGRRNLPRLALCSSQNEVFQEKMQPGK